MTLSRIKSERPKTRVHQLLRLRPQLRHSQKWQQSLQALTRAETAVRFDVVNGASQFPVRGYREQRREMRLAFRI